jgi:predicted phage terminase large subunit-like protein
MTNLELSPKLAEKYLSAIERRLKREQLSTDLIEFTRYFFESRGETFVENWHHRAITDTLKKVETGEIGNLLINMPPRYGKTEIAAINWIAQCIARNPRAKFIHLSYSDDLALDNSAKTRELIRSDEYQALWKVGIKDDADSKKKWYTEQGGGLYATSAGGPITGFGAGSTSEEGFCGAIIIDDPLKVDDAEREGERERVNQRLNTTIKSRRNSRSTPIIIIMQRLHDDDMSGYVLANGMGEKFHHLKLSAIQPDGTALWPFKHTIEELERERAADPRTFSRQMQQEPSPDDGTFFKREWFKRFDIGKEPALVKYGASDYAVTEGGGDYTEHGIAGFDKDEDLWFVDWWSGQTTPDKWIEEELRLARQHEPLAWVAEGGIIRKSVEPFLLREQRTSGIYFRIEWIVSNKDKAANARAFQALASQGKVHIPNTPWGEELISQLLRFPAARYDDKVDVCGLFGRILDQAFGPREIMGAMQPQETDPWGRARNRTNDWKTV